MPVTEGRLRKTLVLPSTSIKVITRAILYSMNTEEALIIVEKALSAERLSKLHATVFCQVWEQRSYQEIAQNTGYEVGYLKQTGSRLWQVLSQVLGEKVSKNNVQSVVKRYAFSKVEPRQDAVENDRKLLRTDWGDATQLGTIYGRTTELATLEQWIVRENCRVVGLFGMGGIGKTTLSVHCAKQIQGEFDYLIWRSLRNAPPITNLLTELLQFLSNQQKSIPNSLDSQILCLLDCLRSARCLLILDNVETIMRSLRGRSAPSHDCESGYQPEYNGYGQLIRCIGETDHQSCLLLTSREKPQSIAAKEGGCLPIRSLQLKGLPISAGQAIFNLKGDFFGSSQEWQRLIAYYSGNPLALNMVAIAVKDFFAGSLTKFLEFLEPGAAVFGDIYQLLAQQFNRLSDLEQQVMYWLAIERKSIDVQQLLANFALQVTPASLLEALMSLERRSLIEKNENLFTLQPVVMEYITHQLIKQIEQEITTNKLQLLKTHALLKTQAKDYIRESQTRLLLSPLAARLLDTNTKSSLDKQLMQIISAVRGKSPQETGYIAGNIINLCCQLQIDLSDRNFSNLTVWQAYLKQVNLHRVNFARTNLANCVFTETFSQILSVAFSPDGKLLAASDINHEIHIWQVSDGKKLLTCKVEDGWVWSVTFSLDSRILASSANRTINLWDVQTGECLQTLPGYTSRIFSLSFSPDNRFLASGSEDKLVRIWNWQTGQLLKTLSGHTDEVRSVTFAPSSQLLASGSYDRTVRLWNTTTGECLHTLIGHKHWVWSVAFSPDGNTLASSSSDKTIGLWDLNGKCKYVLTHSHTLRTLAFSYDGQVLASGSDDTIKLWNLKTKECKLLQGHTSWISSLAFSPNSYLLASGSEDQSVRLWDTQTHRCLKSLQGHSNGIWAVAFSPDGQKIASGSQDRIVRFWHSKTGEYLSCLQGHTSWIWSIAFSPDGHTLASGSEDRTIKLWDTVTGQLLSTLQGHTDAVFSVIFSLDGNTLISGSLDGTIKLWNIEQELYRQIEGHKGGIWCIAQSPDGMILVSGSQDQTVKLWEINTGKCIKTLSGHNSWLRCVAFSPDGQTLASGSANGIVKLWQASTGECLQTWQAHSTPVLSIVFSLDGQYLFTSSTDTTVKLWDMQTLECRQILQEHDKWVRFLSISFDGKILASCSQDETIKLWNMSNLGVETTSSRTLRVPRPYEGMNISGTSGLTSAQIRTLKILGATEMRSPK